LLNIKFSLVLVYPGYRIINLKPDILLMIGIYFSSQCQESRLFDFLFGLITGIYCFILLFFLIGLFFPNKHRTSKKYCVSVVVAARNEQQNIENLLSELIAQSYPSDMYEIIIVNDGSEDRTGEIVDCYARKFSNVKHIQATPDTTTGLFAKKNALNQGIQSSKGEIILSTDADCHIKPAWIETMVSYFADGVGMVVGFSQLGNNQNRCSLFEKLQAMDFLSLMGAAQGSLNFGCPLAASGQNIGYRRAAFDAVGGYEKIKHRISGDDVLLLQLVRKHTNWKIKFAPLPAAFNWTRPEKTLKSFLNQRKRWASNGSYQIKLNLGFFLFILSVFLMNAFVILGTSIYALIYHAITIPLLSLLVKFFIEFLITFKAATVYQRHDLLKYFPIWAVVQIPYVVFTGLLGSLGHFIWKDRKYFQEVTTFRRA